MADEDDRPWPPNLDLGRCVLVIATALAVVVPVLTWWDLTIPLRSVAVVAFLLMVPGAAIAIWVSDDRRSLWFGLAPATSLVVWLLVTLAQALTNTIAAGWSTSAVALLHVLALPGAWRATTTRRRSSNPSMPPKGRLTAMALLAAGLASWVQATRTVDLDAAGARGLVDAAPATYWAAVVLVLGVAGWALTRPVLDRLVLLGAAAAAIVIAYAFVSVAEGVPVAPTTFVHLGITDAIETLGFVPTGIEARFSWPAFFVAAGAAFDASGSTDPLPALVWYPVLANLLLIAPLVALGRALVGTERAGWATVFVFSVLNWVQQDYFSPQSVAFVVLVVLLATLAVLLAESEVPAVRGEGPARLLRLPWRTPGRPVGWSGPRLVALEILLIGLGAGLAVGHQLTPIAAVATTALMSALGVIRFRTLWLSLAAVTLSWFSFGAADWWTGNLAWLLSGVGAVDEAVSSGGLARIGGDPWYQRMQLARVAWSAAIALIAGAGWLSLRRRPAAGFAAAAVAGPVLLIAGQPYGGEIFLRVLLYTSPVVAALAAHALLQAVDRAGRAGPALAMAGLAVAGMGFSVARGVNTAFERTPAEVVAAAEIVLDEAPPRATISPLRAEAPLQVRRFREVDSPQGGGCRRTPLECILRQEPDYVFLTATRDRFDELRNGSIRSYSRRLAAQLLVSGRYRVRIEDSNVIVLVRVDLTPRPPEVPS